MVIEHGETVYTIRIHVVSVETQEGRQHSPTMLPPGAILLTPTPPNGSAQEPSLLLHVPEAAQLLNISRSALYKLLSDPNSGLTPVRIGGSTRVERADIPRFIQLLKQRAQQKRTALVAPPLPAPRRAPQRAPKRRTRM
jgi:excisionase family DNA binding protein